MTARSRKPDQRWLSDLPASSAAPTPRSISISKIGMDAVHSLQPGMASERTRKRMVERLRQQGILDVTVLEAMQAVPRHLFVDEALASRAYEDTALPIAHSQTISQPYIVARMIELALPVDGAVPGKVLEIGTGCGYQAAVLAKVFADVYSIERIRVLHQAARTNLRPLRVPNIRLVHGDGMLGLPQVAPFDAIVIAAAGLELPPALLQQLRVGGKLIAPVGDQEQHLLLVERTGEQRWQQTRLDAVRFVPLIAGTL